MEIPKEFKQEWEEATEELATASEQLNDANIRYNRAILARIALRQRIEYGNLET